MSKKLGIDLGSSSLGWFLRDGESILKKGVIIFNSGMVKDKSGGYSSPTRDRRIARSKRRLIQARKYRKWELLNVLIEYGCVPLTKKELEDWSKFKKGKTRKFPENELFKLWLACDFSYTENGISYKNPYDLRVNAIDTKVSKHELGRALYHIIQRRGYKDIGEKDKETKTQIERRGVSGFDAAMNNSRTIAEALNKEFLKKKKRARNEYPYRAEYEKELIEIIDAQDYDISKNDNEEYVDEFVKKIRKAIIWQRPLRSQKGNIGKCTLEKTKPRCPASHPIFEIFRAWQYINTIKTICRNKDGYIETDEIPIDFKKKLFEDVFLKQDRNFKFDKIQKYLDKLFNEKKDYNYFNKSSKKYDSSVSGMPVCKGLISIFGEKVKSEIPRLHEYTIGTKSHTIIGRYSIYDLWHLIFETDEDHIEDFAAKKLEVATIRKTNRKGEEYFENPVVKFKNTSFSTSYSNLSLKAMCKIIPFLQEGFLYNDAVLFAKMPDVIDNWKEKKDLVYNVVNGSNEAYNKNKEEIFIANSLISRYKSLMKGEIFAYKDYEYEIKEDDKKDVVNACISFFGKKTWQQKNNQEKIIEKVSQLYQDFFYDSERDYRKLPTLTRILKKELEKEGIELKGRLYHHSDRGNLYPKPIYNEELQKKLLAVPLIDSIKNPMFNKAMSILRKLINELLIQEYVDEDGVIQSYIDENTEIIVEVARELNDNNKRIAIERYQRERRNQREKYREFIKEVKGEDEKNIENDIFKFEIWTEQLAEDPIDKKYQTKNQEILAEKDALRRYQLWMEQKGQCMYTGRIINISQLFSSEIEIEHTIPRSLLPDNTMANLTVCFAKYNSDIKNNRIPKECPNFDTSKDLPEIGRCSAIEPRLEKWENLREHYKKLYLKELKPAGIENEDNKNTRIQRKHYFKMHYDYWRDKVERFTSDEIKESWVRRQLTDTQMVSKYAREYLKTHFKKVLVQKGSTTAEYRKIFGIQGNEKKDRSKHTHHCIDAAVLTLIPTNSSKRIELLEQLYKEEENNQKITRKLPDGFRIFNSKLLIDLIERETLIVNYEKDRITEPTYRNVRKRGKLQYLKDDDGNFIRNENGDKILLKAKGTSIRGDLFKDTYLGKIRNVERDIKGKPVRENGKWKYLTGENEFTFVVRKSIVDAKIDDIIDPDIKQIIREQLNNGIDIRKIKDHQGNIIRHVRVKTNTGRKVKNRINYKSKYGYKNSYYSSAGTVPYAILILNIVNGRVERMMIPIPIHEVAQIFKEYHKFTAELFLNKFYPNVNGYQDLRLLKVGQKVFVLNGDDEYENRMDVDFQMKRMYKITQFSDGNIWLKYHLEAKDKNEIKNSIKDIKSDMVQKLEEKLGLPVILENDNIEDVKKRRKDFEDRKYKFSSLKDYRLNRLREIVGEEEVRKLKERLDKYKAFSSTIELEGRTPLMKTSKNNWNFLFENYDFEVNITGDINWIV